MDSAVFSQEIKNNVFNILNLCNQKNIKIVTAESCTGGLIAGCLTEVPGSSRVVEGGFVTYSNNLKNSILLVKLVNFSVWFCKINIKYKTNKINIIFKYITIINMENNFITIY